MSEARDADEAPTAGGDDDARDAAIRRVEGEFSEIAQRFQRIVMRNAELLSPGLLPGAYKVFTTIVRHGPVKASELTERMMVDKSQLSRLIAILEERELVVRSPDPHDRRAQLLEATPAAKARLEEVRGPREYGLLRELRRWPVADVERLADLLHTLVQGAPGGPADE
ncbi:MarR family winged helix-turn-helix transcriptional regulator [Microbacterium sp. Marseille-Q6965]|uniref:MarR family winged helix-turn-helix transcriptional regulator n=1 Tax=Microbacterium sp. Marseille-Q6965 TaxID=2965072 RepID=UPI0021B7A569|nr:MarR family transcriptional regulator [Microbacterium sp. Marseille-Q6965]